MKIYLAGPDVFLPDALDIGWRKLDICARFGLTGLYPLDNAIDLSTADASLQIFRGNAAMMDDADAIIAAEELTVEEHDLACFETCVKLAATHFAASSRASG
jgi:nucleoside 2-deoxyribosyltransferase